MALLSAADRARVARGLMRRWSKDSTSCSFVKGQLYDQIANTGMIPDVDGWVDSRAGLTAPDTIGFNGALNATYRALPSVNQKTDLFLAVAAMRRGLDYVRAVFGEVD